MQSSAGFTRTRHYFSFGECCVAVDEFLPARHPGVTPLLRKRPEVFFFIHGGLGQPADWDSVVAALGARFRCLVIALPGHGASIVVGDRLPGLRELSSLVMELMAWFLAEEEQAVLIGQDHGAVLAEVCAVRVSAAVAGIVLLNPVSLFHAYRTPQGSGAGGVGRRRRVEHAWRRGWPGPKEREEWKKWASRSGCRGLLLWGRITQGGAWRDASELLQIFPDMRCYENLDGGAEPALSAPAWVASRIQQFVFSLEEAPTVAQASARPLAGRGAFAISARRSPWR